MMMMMAMMHFQNVEFSIHFPFPIQVLEMRNLSGSNPNQWMIDGLRSAGEHVNKFSNTMDLSGHVTYFYRKLYI